MSILFKSKYHPLSNFYKIKGGMSYEGLTFNTSEQAYQWKKATTHRQYYIARLILQETEPGKQKAQGSRVQTGLEWERRKRQFMTEILKEKVKVCDEYKQFLVASGSKALIENTTDSYWARGRDNKGRNVLGVIHCMIRANIKANK